MSNDRNYAACRLLWQADCYIDGQLGVRQGAGETTDATRRMDEGAKQGVSGRAGSAHHNPTPSRTISQRTRLRLGRVHEVLPASQRAARTDRSGMSGGGGFVVWTSGSPTAGP